MDVCESEKVLRKQSVAEKTRQPLVSAENKHGVLRQVQTRDVRSRYKSPTPPSPTDSKRCSSPFASRTSSAPTVSASKRATSAERKRPSSSSSPRTPSTPRSPSTPIQDTTAETLLASRKTVGNKLPPESLWPSTMRSLSVSFQSESYSVPISKREKPASPRVSSNVAHKQAEAFAPRKPTPERKQSPLKGKNYVDQSENSKSVDGLDPRLMDQHRWPSRTAGKVPFPLDRSVDLSDKTSKHSSRFHRPSLRRLSLDGIIKPLIKSASDLKSLVSLHDIRKSSKDCPEDDSSSQMEKLPSPASSSSSDRTQLSSSAARAVATPTPPLRPPSPIVTRGVSPSRAKSLNPFHRLPSPSRVRPASPTRQSQSSHSVLRFIADIKPAKKAASQIEDVHQLRLLYNRHLQWRYMNACSDSSLHSQKLEAETMLYNVWMTNADLWDSIMKKRIDLLQLRLKLKLYSVLCYQLPCLDEWASTERDHINSLTGLIQDLQARAIRIPFTGRARGDMETVKAAISSAVDVMHAIGFSLGSLLSKVVGMNSLVSQLANLALQERAMMYEYEFLLGSTIALQAEEQSLRAHLLQLNAWGDEETSMFGY